MGESWLAWFPSCLPGLRDMSNAGDETVLNLTNAVNLSTFQYNLHNYHN